MVIPIAIGGFFEYCSNDTIAFVDGSGVLDIDLPRASFLDDDFSFKKSQNLADALSENRSGGVSISAGSAILITLICWIAAGLWVIRHIGGGKFLTCSTIAALATVLFLIVLSNAWSPSNEQQVLLRMHFFKFQVGEPGIVYRCSAAVALFALTFVIGLYTDRYKEYVLWTCYLGTLVLSCFVFSITIASDKASLISLSGMLLIVVLSVSLVDLVFRKAMTRFLYDPR